MVTSKQKKRYVLDDLKKRISVLAPGTLSLIKGGETNSNEGEKQEEDIEE
ncbi:MAG: hypothetical protein AAFX87_17170 [Bacteroidota bacterium]